METELEKVEHDIRLMQRRLTETANPKIWCGFDLAKEGAETQVNGEENENNKN